VGDEAPCLLWAAVFKAGWVSWRSGVGGLGGDTLLAVLVQVCVSSSRRATAMMESVWQEPEGEGGGLDEVSRGRAASEPGVQP
jgi:hypothetical protein